MSPRTATWWGRAERALRPFFKRLAKLARGHARREAVRVRVRSLERGAVPFAPIAIGDRAGWLSLVAGASDGAIEERCY